VDNTKKSQNSFGTSGAAASAAPSMAVSARLRPWSGCDGFHHVPSIPTAPLKQANMKGDPSQMLMCKRNVFQVPIVSF